MSDGAGKPKPAFFIAVLAVVVGLVGFAFYRCNAKKADDKGADYIDPNIVKQGGGSGSGATTAENPDPNATGTTKTEYEFEPSQKLSQVPGTSEYKALGTPRVVQFA